MMDDVQMKEIECWAATRADDAGRLAKIVISLRRDGERLDWLQNSTKILPSEVSDLVNGFRWKGKYRGSLREAIDASMGVTEE